MVEIRMTDTFIAELEAKGFDLNRYILQIGESKYLVPTVSNMKPDDFSGPGMIEIRPYEPFLLENGQFQVLVSSGLAGDIADFLNNIIYLVKQNKLEVAQDGGPTAMTVPEILSYVASS